MSKMSNLQLQIEEAKEDMCDNYCKYPAEYSLLYEDSEVAHDCMVIDVCQDCPLNRIGG